MVSLVKWFLLSGGFFCYVVSLVRKPSIHLLDVKIMHHIDKSRIMMLLMNSIKISLEEYDFLYANDLEVRLTYSNWFQNNIVNLVYHGKIIFWNESDLQISLKFP